MDAKSVAMSMIRQADEANAMKHCEFVINRVGLGRGGEHLFLRWTGGSWDFFFNGFDITWTTIKTCSDQCMLLFCDRSLYYLCPFFLLRIILCMVGFAMMVLTPLFTILCFHTCMR